MADTPHDALFYATFSNPEHAAGELQAVLPPALAAKIDFASLALEPGRFVDAKLSNRYSDLLFSAQIAERQGFVYILFEHLSTGQVLALLRLLEYMVRIWRNYVSKHRKTQKLPIIVPVLLHHSDTGWMVPKRFRDVLDVTPELWDAVAPFIPDFTAVFDDISHVDPECLKQRPMTPQGKLVLYCLRYGRTPGELFQGLPGWVDILLAVATAYQGETSISAMLEYLQSVTKLDERSVIMAMSETLGESAAERIIHAGERLVERGRREGERSTFLHLLRARFGELPATVVARVQASGSKEIDEMVVRYAKGLPLDEVVTTG
jgi:hypothetical protein